MWQVVTDSKQLLRPRLKAKLSWQQVHENSNGTSWGGKHWQSLFLVAFLSLRGTSFANPLCPDSCQGAIFSRLHPERKVPGSILQLKQLEITTGITEIVCLNQTKAGLVGKSLWICENFCFFDSVLTPRPPARRSQILKGFLAEQLSTAQRENDHLSPSELFWETLCKQDGVKAWDAECRKSGDNWSCKSASIMSALCCGCGIKSCIDTCTWDPAWLPLNSGQGGDTDSADFKVKQRWWSHGVMLRANMIQHCCKTH